MSIKALKPGVYLKNHTYRIDGILGQGTFGITYLASAKVITEGNLGRMEVEAKVAVKEFFMSEVNSRKDDSSDIEGSSGNIFTNYRRKFRKEAENLAKLSHKGIVKVLDVFDENNTTYYVMEFISGQNLDDYIMEKGAIPGDEAIKTLTEVGEALDYMHSKKMLHLDLKPKNIMIRPDGSACLIDFGLSKQFSEGGEPESSTSIGLGTPGYAPIEQAAYRQDGTFPATLDVYALGATFFKMLTGSRVPDAAAVLYDGFPEQTVRSKGVSNKSVRALMNAMNPIKTKRTQTIQKLIDALNGEAEDYEETSFASSDSEETKFESSNTTTDSQTATDGNSTPPPSNGTAGSASSGGYTPPPTTGYSSGSASEEPQTSKWKDRFITAGIIIFAALAVVFCIWFYRTKYQQHTNNSTADSSQVTENIAVEEKVIKTVTNMSWNSPLGPASYTGEVIADTIEGSNDYLPHGNGKAIIVSGEYGGNSYDGEFYYGKMEGRTTYTLSNGDTYVGKFKDNKYDRGRYKFKSTGEYFEGTFVNGQPNKGNWYNKNGKPL